MMRPPLNILESFLRGILISVILICSIIYQSYNPTSKRVVLLCVICPCVGMLAWIVYLIIVFAREKRRCDRGLKGVPGIIHGNNEVYKKYHWFWGDFGNFRFHMNDFPQYRLKCIDSNPPIARITRPPIFVRINNVHLVDPRDVKHILKDNFENYVKPPDFIENFSDALGTGIFVTNHGPHAEDKGKRWYKQRKSSAKIFTRQNFKSFFLEQFALGSESVCKVLNKYSTSGEKLDLQRLMGNFTLDSIGHVAFGSNLECLDREIRKVSGTELSASQEFAIAFDRAQNCAIQRFMTPFRKLFPRFLRRYVFKAERDVMETRRVMVKFCNKMIDEAIQCRDMNKKKWDQRHDLLAMHIKDTSAKHTRSDLTDMILSFFIAGRDTTRATLTFLFKVLCQNPDIQKKLLEEINDVFGSGSRSSTPTFDELQRKSMPYLDGLVQEVLRLYPPVYSDPKFCCKDDVLPSGITIPAETTVSYVPYAMGRLKNFLYGPEPLKVDPNRWKKIPNDYNFPVFQGGPRVCLGKRMAYLEVKILVVTVLKKGYRFKLDENQDLECYNLQPTLVLEHGLKVKVVRRGE